MRASGWTCLVWADKPEGESEYVSRRQYIHCFHVWMPRYVVEQSRIEAERMPLNGREFE